MAEFARFDGGITSPIILAQGLVEGSHGPFDVVGVRCHENPSPEEPGHETLTPL
jgi:hypothetical protein